MNASLSLLDFAALSPLLIVLITALIVLLVESFSEIFSTRYSFWITLAGLLLALYASFASPVVEDSILTHWMRFDSLARFFTGFFILIGIASALLAAAFFQRFDATHGEYYFLLLSAIFGLILIGNAADFLTLFIGLETLSISLYIMCGYMKKWESSHEASMKYFLMGALGAAFLLYGIALIYGAVGTTRFEGLLQAFQAIDTTQNKMLFYSGIALVTLGLAFKAAIVPFHVWAPDVYDGAPTPVTAFMAVGTKAGAFAAFIRVFFVALPQFDTTWNEVISWLAYPTLIYANLVALRQIQLRRFFAYSGISHAGYMLIPLAAGTSEALPALLFYLVVYSLATLACFAVLAFLDQRGEGVMLRDLYGLFRRSPFLAGVLALGLLTLSGIPPTVGFFAKFYLFKVAFQAGYYGLVIVGLLMAIISAFYYLRIVSVMLSEAPSESAPPVRTWPAAAVGVTCLAAILILSCYPTPFLDVLGQISTTENTELTERT